MDGVFHLPSGWVGLSWMIPLYQCAHCIALVGEEDDGGLALPSSPAVGGWVGRVGLDTFCRRTSRTGPTREKESAGLFVSLVSLQNGNSKVLSGNLPVI